MNRAQYKSKRKGQRKRNSTISKSRIAAKAKEWTAYTTPKLREIYFKQIEWATKIIPKIKEK